MNAGYGGRTLPRIQFAKVGLMRFLVHRLKVQYAVSELPAVAPGRFRAAAQSDGL